MKKDDLVLLQKFYYPAEANMARGLLETNDIPCFIFDEYTNRAGYPIAPAAEGVRLMVREKDLNEALKILQECKDSPVEK